MTDGEAVVVIQLEQIDNNDIIDEYWTRFPFSWDEWLSDLLSVDVSTIPEEIRRQALAFLSVKEER